MSDTKLWYDKPAKEWLSALPIANGHMGAMVYGGELGRYDLSENTCWSGQKEEGLPEHAQDNMQRAREALLRKDYAAGAAYLEKCAGIKGNYGTQLPMGKLFVSVEKESQRQTRELDLMTGVAVEHLFYPDGNVIRTSFVSNPDKVMVVSLVVDAGCQLGDVRIWMEGYNEPSKTQVDGNQIIVEGDALEAIHSDGLHGVRYACMLQYETDGVCHWSRRGMIITGATNVICFITAATDMFMPDYQSICRERLACAADKGYSALVDAHVREHSGWMERCTFHMPSAGREMMTTDKRMTLYRQDHADHGLVTLMFQYGRYLLLNSSRPDSLLPAALQGVWNDNRACRMEWTDDMHLDINTEMNYYPAEATGLGECAKPLFSWIKGVLQPQGRMIAKQLYGAEGWVAHAVSNAFGYAAPGWSNSWGFFVNGGTWVAVQLWEHYLFTGDKDFLREYWNTIKECAEFQLSLLSVEPETGKLVTVPSYSPENCFRHEDSCFSMTVGSTVDTVMTRYICEVVMKSAEILGVEDPVLERIQAVLPMLPGYQIGKRGRLQEWLLDYEDAFPDHRHTSHLTAIYPLNQINIEDHPELMEAARCTLECRLGTNAKDIVYTNWAGALLMIYHARLRMAEDALQFIHPMIGYLARENMMITHEGDTSSPIGGIYELDGNTGFTSGVVEMLIQCYKENEIHLLPALPAQWQKGSCTGLRVYGGHILDLEWQDGLLKRAYLQPGKDGVLNLHYKQTQLAAMCKRGQRIAFGHDAASETVYVLH